MDTLTYLTLIITYQCSSRCEHCCLGAGPEFNEWMSLEDAEYYLAEITRKNHINLMTLIGGEALLDVDRTIAIGKLALRYGIANVDVDTNGSWAVDEENALRILQRLIDARLTISAISVDTFHQRHVSRERALCAMRAARKLGLDIGGSSEILDAEDAVNIYDTETREIADWFKQYDFDVRPGLPPNVIFQGRAVNLADACMKPRSIPRETCSGVPWFSTEDFRQPGGLQIDVHGWVMVEHGICIGNAKSRPLKDILTSYNVQDHPIIRVLIEKGPLGLTEIPEAEGFMLREEGYVNKCHLCQEIRTFLRPRFPDILCPENYYPKIT